MVKITLKQLLANSVHFGHQASRWNPKMFPYIYKKQNGIHIIDLVQTARLLNYSYNYVKKASQENKQFFFIGTKKHAINIIEDEAKKCGANFVNHRWLGGTLTNWSTIQSRVSYLKKLDKKRESNDFEKIPKKEAALLKRRHDKLKQNLGGLRNMNKIPDIAIIVDPKREHTAVAECRKLNIPIIAIIDTNCDPNLIDIPIPANDDAVSSLKLILSILSNAIISGQQLNT